MGADITTTGPDKGHDRPLIATTSTRLDGRTRLAKRQAALVRTYSEALGGWWAMSPSMRLRVEAAVEMALVAELTRGRFLAGEGATADDTVRTARAASQAVKALGISEAPTKPTRATLDAYLREKANTAGAAR